jgi:hypothetical protein
MIMEWGIVARSRSTGIQIRKQLTEAYTDPELAIVAAADWAQELNTESKFGLNDWVGRYDHVEGGPTENNVNPAMIEHPPHAQPDRDMPGTAAMGMNGRL